MSDAVLSVYRCDVTTALCVCVHISVYICVPVLHWLATGKSSSTLSCILKGVTKCPERQSLIGLPGCQGQRLSDRLGNEGREEDECHPRVCPTHVISFAESDRARLGRGVYGVWRERGWYSHKKSESL